MKSRFKVAQEEDHWVVCDATDGKVILDTCPCCCRQMLTERAAKAVAEVVEKRPAVQ